MNPQQLKSVVAVSGGVLRLKLDDLASASLTQLFEPYLPEKALVVNNVTQRTETSDSVTVIGTGGNRIFAGMQVTARFSLGPDQNAAVLITAQGPSDWAFDKSFPALQRSIFAELQFQPSPTLYLSSHKVSEQIGVGMMFEGTLAPNSVLGAFGFLLGGGEHKLSGTILFAGDTPDLVLFGPVNASANLGFLQLSNVRYEVYGHARYDSARFQWETDSYVGISADLKFRAQNREHTITLLANVYDPASSVLFITDLTEGLDAALDELAVLANGVGLSVPIDNFQIGRMVKLTDLKVMVNPTGSKKIEYLTLGVETSDEWTLINDLLELEAIDVSFRIDDPLGTPRLSGVLSGLVGIGATGTLELSAFFGEYAFGGGLRQGAPLSIKEVFAHFLGLSNSDLPDLNLSHFDFYVQPTTKSYSGLIELEAGQWTIPLGATDLRLEDLKLSLDRAGDGAPIKMDVLGIFGVGDFHLIVEADYQGVNTGWTFTGSTLEGQAVPLGRFIQDLIEVFRISGDLPASIADATIKNLLVTFNTLRKDFTFTCEGALRIDDREVTLVVAVDLKSSNNKYTRSFSGTLTIGTLNFDLHFSANNTSSFFLSTYSHSGGPQSLNIKELVGRASSAIATYIPPSLEIELKDVLLAFSKETGGTKFLFGLDVGASINLSNLPLVGQKFLPDQTLSVDDLQLLIASKGLTQPEAKALNSMLPANVTKLPEQIKDSNQDSTDTASSSAGSVPISLPDGLTVAAKVRWGGSVEMLTLPVAGGAQPSVPGSRAGTTTTTPAPVDKVKWFTVQKSFGPVHFEKVGVQYQNDVLWFLLDASLSAAGLTISLDGLAVGSPLKSFAPKFKLQGLGIDYNGGGVVEIGGAFLRTEGTTDDGKKYDKYEGTAVIKTKSATISGLGSYARLSNYSSTQRLEAHATEKELNEHPSLFVYAFLDYPLGGPAFFFVTGLAAGFGYNRKLIAPPIEKVAKFPLVQQAVAGQAHPNGLVGVLQDLQIYIPPAIGEAFLAVGVKFNSFKLIDSFALLTIEFGSHVVFNILGLSTAIIPTPKAGTSVTPLAEVQMAWKATFDPEQGFLGLSAQLTPRSYILSRDCHLTGGYAFYCWFTGEHAGDFVHTLGGYHPSFNVPAHYPVVPRLQFNWQVTSNLTLKGDAYYALTGSALMAGGHLAATWESGDLKAWFNAGADFLIMWKPYHYDASIYVDVGVSYTCNINLLFTTVRTTISVDVGADLHIWGPNFSGKAHVHLWIISFSISFGADASEEPQPIDWSTFKASFLPERELCGVSVKEGLVNKEKQGNAELWVINPKQFSLVTNSAIPFSIVNINSKSDAVVNQIYYTQNGTGPEVRPFNREAGNGKLIQAHEASDQSRPLASIAIGSMGVQPNQLTSRCELTITRDQAAAESDFVYLPILKKVPAGLWGAALVPELNGERFIENALTGFEIRPKHEAQAGETAPIDRSKLQYSPDTIVDAYDWERPISFVAGSQDDAARRQIIRNTIKNNSTREQLLQALGVSAGINVSDVADAFLIAPLTGALAG